MPRPTPLRACLGILLTCPSVAVAQDGIDFKAEHAKYEEYLRRPSLRKRTDGRVYFAQTRDPRARDVLIKSYGKPEDPSDHNRYLIATIVTDHFALSTEDEVFDKWRRRFKKPIDAWLWFETLRIEPMRKRRESLMEIVTGRESPYIRAAAFNALIEHSDSHSVDPDFVAWLSARLDESPSREVDRALMLEPVGATIVKKRSNVRQEPWKELCRKLIHTTFDDDATPQRSKIVIARYLAETFDCQNLGFESQFWISELDRDPRARRGSSGETSSVGFAGIRTKGDHIVYVIDASDSMCKPVSGKIDRSGPTTGGDRPKVEKGVVPTADDLDWDRIHTRFDAAREFLRLSLGSLEEGSKFAVVLFGKDAEALQSTPTLVKSTPQNVDRALKELYSIDYGAPRQPDRPHGTLRGTTNLHGGIRLAYRMTNSGITQKAEYADTKSMLEGCDTVFILSDGAPSTDDWLMRDKAEPHDQAGDPESHHPQEQTEYLIFQGPYAGGQHTFLAEDVERMNLLRRCEIHCVAIGEAEDHLLERIAKIGHGESIRIDSRLKDRK